MATNEIADFIRATYAALVSASAPEPEAGRAQPAVAIRKSVTPEAVICLECGKPQKMLKRHISTAHGLSVEDYRAKWGLGPDYPMVAPDYAQHRSALARKIGLGTNRKRTAKAIAAPSPVAAEKPKRGRRPKAAAE